MQINPRNASPHKRQFASSSPLLSLFWNQITTATAQYLSHLTSLLRIFFYFLFYYFMLSLSSNVTQKKIFDDKINFIDTKKDFFLSFLERFVLGLSSLWWVLWWIYAWLISNNTQLKVKFVIRTKNCRVRHFWVFETHATKVHK